MKIQRIGSKWIKTKVLLANEKIKPYIPRTRVLGLESLNPLLNKYRMVYVKPDRGTAGFGIFRVEKISDNQLQYQVNTRLRTFSSIYRLYSSLKKHKLKRTYIIQQGIHLLKYNNKPFDVRIMVQQDINGQWKVTGYLGRVAHPKKIVTNYHDGGTPMPFVKLMASYLPEKKIKEMIKQLKQLGLIIASQMEAKYPRIKEIGIDIGIDKHYKPWIFEVNTKPDPFIFNRLKDKRMFHRIYRYAVGYGRFKRN